MSKRITRRAVCVAVCAIALVGGSSSAAFAGEVNGTGRYLHNDQLPGKSICAYSGLNDEYYVGGDTSAPRVQSFGQIVSTYGPQGGVPGQACNPNTGGEG
jgi:hypothetical protein